MMLTLGQAARETGLSKTAISRAIKSGRLSATRSDQGEYQIDPVELFRVYPVTGNVDGELERYATPKDNAGLQGHIDVLRELVRQIEGERDDLRRRLDNAEEARQREAEAREQAAAEIRRLTLMLTDQRQSVTPPAPKPATVRPTFWLALAIATLAAIAWFLWPGWLSWN